jgi:hypothetical protein
MDSMSKFIRDLASADDESRRAMLAGRLGSSGSSGVQDEDILVADTVRQDAPMVTLTPNQAPEPSEASTEAAATFTSPTVDGFIGERPRDGRMRKMLSRQATQFFGGTSLAHLDLPASNPTEQVSSKAGHACSMPPRGPLGGLTFPLDPHGLVCRRLVSLFFANCYQYNHFIYREFFLRDYAACSGPYYSGMLLHAICAVGAIVSEDTYLNSLHVAVADFAESQALASLDSPDLTTLQTLMICGPLAVGRGQGSKGWLFCGMAFRLAHEMGLHLDPSNWNLGIAHSSVDREILRRVYWATFVADKQMSLYFGRPPALYPQEADVRNTLRIPYPPEWEHLLDTYIASGTSVTAFEDGIAVVGSFVHRVELAKIFHTMIVAIFENRDGQANKSAEIVKATNQVHLELERWLSQLPQKLQWNPWKVTKVPHYILHLHMVFHTGMIILHRPPSRCSDADLQALTEDVDICYQSLAAILRLLNSYGRHYSFRTLPLDVVHTLAAAARIIMLKKRLEQAPWTNMSAKKPMEDILHVMRAISTVWPCIAEIKTGIEIMMQSDSQELQVPFYGGGPDFLTFLDNGCNLLSTPWSSNVDQTQSDLGFLVTEDSLNDFEGWQNLTE